jgi:hypothetical protein
MGKSVVYNGAYKDSYIKVGSEDLERAEDVLSQNKIEAQGFNCFGELLINEEVIDSFEQYAQNEAVDDLPVEKLRPLIHKFTPGIVEDYISAEINEEDNNEVIKSIARVCTEMASEIYDFVEDSVDPDELSEALGIKKENENEEDEE